MRGSYILNDDVYSEIFSIVQTVDWISNVFAVVVVVDDAVGNVSQLLPTSFYVVVAAAMVQWPLHVSHFITDEVIFEFFTPNSAPYF